MYHSNTPFVLVRKTIILSALIILLFAAMPSRAQDGDTQTFVSQSGLIFDYPADWFVSDFFIFIYVSSDEASAAQSEPVNEDSVVLGFMFGTPTEISGVLGESVENLDQLHSFFLEGLEETGGTIISDKVVELGGRDVLVIVTEVEGETQLIYLADIDGNLVISAVSANDPAQIDANRPTIDGIVASLRYDPDADKVDEDQALMERIIAAVEATESYESFVLTETYSIAGSATIIPLTYMQTETSYVHRVSHVIRGNSPNVQSFFTIRSQQHEFEEEMITNIVQGEIRFVDNTYYLTAEAIKGNELSAEVSDGWVMFTADSSQEVLRDLLMPSVEELDSDELWGALIDNSVTIDTSNLDAVGNLIDFRISQDVLEDGTPVDVITMSFDFDRIIQRSSVSSSPEDEPTEADIERELLRNIQFEVSFFIDEQGRLVGRHDYIKTFANSADLAQNSDEEDDQTAYPEIEIRVEVQENKTTFYTNINEALTPVEAPADAVPAE